jgi:hypothetical protein
MVGSQRRIGGSNRSRAGQFLRSRLIYIRGAGHIGRNNQLRCLDFRGALQLVQYPAQQLTYSIEFREILQPVQTSGICQSIADKPVEVSESLIREKQREPKNFLADKGDGCAEEITTC